MEFIGQSPQPDGSEIAAKVVSIFSITLIALLFGVKTYNVHFRYLTYSRWLILALYLLSWSFSTLSMILVTTNNRNFTSCFLSIMVCDIFYSGTKIAIYAWLIEKVYVVSSIRTTRWKSKAYRFHLVLMTPYIAIFTLMMVFHIAEIDDSGICIIGLQSIASLPLLIYDFLINLYMTIFFIRPLLKLGSGAKKIDWKASRLNEVALRTLVASVVCLIASFANVFSLVMFDGRERGLVCLTCCTVDVTINVTTIHWVTSHSPNKRVKDNMEYSTSQRDSNPEISSHRSQAKNNDFNLRDNNHSDIDVMAATDLQHRGHTFGTNFADKEFDTSSPKTAPPYEPNPNTGTTTKRDDRPSSDSNFFSPSLQESHNSRKSLTKT
ncbi:hypothetical protein BDF21DRAFT_419557 [Thamnidium elegans]|nr:hypothetical protein BDF21DRAFT_419557 [Thamnidium elegans]